MNSRPHENAGRRLDESPHGSDVDGVIDALLDGDLSPQAAEAMQRRLEAHPGARAELESLRRAADSLRPPVESPDFARSVWREVAVRSALENPLAFRGQSGGWVLPVSIAAGLALVAGAAALMVGFPNRSASPHASPAISAPETSASPTAAAPSTAMPEPGTSVGESAASTVARSQRPALPLGPTDRHEIQANWSTELAPGTDLAAATPLAPESIAGQIDPVVEPGQLISVRVGPAWTLWWVPPDGSSPHAKTMQLLTRISTPTNATVEKPGPMVKPD